MNATLFNWNFVVVTYQKVQSENRAKQRKYMVYDWIKASAEWNDSIIKWMNNKRKERKILDNVNTILIGFFSIEFYVNDQITKTTKNVYRTKRHKVKYCLEEQRKQNIKFNHQVSVNNIYFHYLCYNVNESWKPFCFFWKELKSSTDGTKCFWFHIFRLLYSFPRASFDQLMGKFLEKFCENWSIVIRLFCSGKKSSDFHKNVRVGAIMYFPRCSFRCSRFSSLEDSRISSLFINLHL